MKTAQLYRKRNGVIALRYATFTLTWLGVIFRDNFTEDKLTALCRYLSYNFYNAIFVCLRYFP